MSAQKIDRIFGFEPGRDGEYPQCFIVGEKHGLKGYTVTSIEYYVTNFGDHGVGWYAVKCDDILLAEMNAKAVAEVHYVVPELDAA
jgi:hypothetical protein